MATTMNSAATVNSMSKVQLQRHKTEERVRLEATIVRGGRKGGRGDAPLVAALDAREPHGSVATRRVRKRLCLTTTNTCKQSAELCACDQVSEQLDVRCGRDGKSTLCGPTNCAFRNQRSSFGQAIPPATRRKEEPECR